MRRALLLLTSMLIATSCSIGSAIASSPPTRAVGSPGFTPISTLTTSPATIAAVSDTTTPTGAPIPAQTFVPFHVTSGAPNLALRTGPGYLFTRIGLLPEGVSLAVLGRSRGGEWALVQTTDNRVGWMFIQLINAGGRDWSTVPYSEPLGAQLITGVVKDELGVPISGIQFAFTQGSGALAPRTDAMTDAAGIFYAYLPSDIRGQWYVSYTAISCTSNTMDAGCNPKNGVGGMPYPRGQYVTLPLPPPATLDFVWK